MTKRRKVVVLFGGRSTEHEVSLRSAAFILRNLNPDKYDILAIGIDHDGRWIPQNTANMLKNMGESVTIGCPESSGDDSMEERIARSLIPTIGNHAYFIHPLSDDTIAKDLDGEEIVVFPVLHGTYGEDGCLQGMLEMSSVAYVGADTISSAICMDKVVAKELVKSVGIAVVPYVSFRAHQWERDASGLLAKIVEELQFPVFIKPANLGSSVGISRVGDRSALVTAIEQALDLDEKLLIEKAMNIREIQFAALGGYEPDISGAGEIDYEGSFYSYGVKYLGEKASSSMIPASLTPEKAKEGQAISKRIYEALQLYGMARIDLFLTKDEGKFYFNEANTIPGFTNVSQYGQLWRQEGIEPGALMDRLIDAAVVRQKRRKKLVRSFR